MTSASASIFSNSVLLNPCSGSAPKTGVGVWLRLLRLSRNDGLLIDGKHLTLTEVRSLVHNLCQWTEPRVREFFLRIDAGEFDVGLALPCEECCLQVTKPP